MKIRVVPEARSLDPESVRGHVVVVIDTLRATTSIPYAIAAGATVEPVRSIAEARRRRKAGKVFIAGERGGRTLPGFDFGNSPVELGKAPISGKRLVLTTTNGTGAVARSAEAREIYVGAIVNAGALARAVMKHSPEQLDLVCAGRTTGVALEDLVGAGAIIDAILPPTVEMTTLTDGARLSLELFRREKNHLAAFLRGCESGRNLIKLGALEDLEVCAQLDVLDVAPRLSRGRFTA